MSCPIVRSTSMSERSFLTRLGYFRRGLRDSQGAPSQLPGDPRGPRVSRGAQNIGWKNPPSVILGFLWAPWTSLRLEFFQELCRRALILHTAGLGHCPVWRPRLCAGSLSKIVLILCTEGPGPNPPCRPRLLSWVSLEHAAPSSCPP
jgi:hypothetical protein